MASNQTSNYGLNQWEATDQVLRTDFNADNDKIDAALKELADTVAGQGNILAGQGTVIPKLGNCKIEHFTYRGTGRYGANGPTRITFSKLPVLFLILDTARFALGSRFTDWVILDVSSGNKQAPASWSGNQVSFYSEGVDWQLNMSGTTYHVFAFYDMSEE